MLRGRYILCATFLLNMRQWKLKVSQDLAKDPSLKEKVMFTIFWKMKHTMKSNTEVVHDRIEVVSEDKMEWIRSRGIKLPNTFREHMAS